MGLELQKVVSCHVGAGWVFLTAEMLCPASSSFCHQDELPLK